MSRDEMVFPEAQIDPSEPGVEHDHACPECGEVFFCDDLECENDEPMTCGDCRA